jgi:hypothetical protein
MPKARLRDSIQKILGALEDIEAKDPEARDRLANVLVDIREALEASEESTSDEKETLIDRLNEATGQFEEAHPQLTAMVGRVADSLANLGI